MVYDRLDWHFDSAVDGGQPPENAFTHIGFYLAWLIRNDLHDPEVIPPDHVEAVKSGEMTGSELADDVDTKLVADAMNETGRAFSDARYGAYCDEYSELFKDLPDYGVADEPANYERAAGLLDRLYGEWVADGRPEAPPSAADVGPSSVGATFVVPPELTEAQLNEMLGAWHGSEVEVRRGPTGTEATHVGPELEALIPRDLTSPPMEIDSAPASAWGSSLLTRALKRLAVRPKDAVVVSAMGGFGEQTLSVFIYGVPGASAERLESEFRSVIFRLPGSTWEPRD